MKYISLPVNNIRAIISVLLIILVQSCVNNNDELFESTNLDLKLQEDGTITFLGKKDKNGNSRSYTSNGIKSYLIRIKYFDNEAYSTPKHASWKRDNDNFQVTVKFPKNEVKIKLINKESYFTAELIELTEESTVELVSWGPYQLDLSDKIGKSIGVVYNDDFAIGLMGLNLKSRGGFEILPRERLGNTAQKNSEGATLQGFVRNRNIGRVANNCFQELTDVVPIEGLEGNLIGSKYAFYGTLTDNVSNLISEIEKAENLPYLTHNGEWLKNTDYATSPRFLMPYNIHNIDACLDIAEKAGVNCVYHPGIFKSWGHFQVREKNFPKGYESVRVCTEKAKARNITLGAHALSNFITTSDPFVSPKPSPDLQLAGVTTLKNNISEEAIELELSDQNVRIAYTREDLERLNETELKANENKNKEIFAVLLGDEIIEFDSVSKEGTLKLLGCKRGAYGTIPSAHSKGDKVGRLVSHYYKVFFGNIKLQDQVAKNLANFFNETGLERISFDGIEGGLASGHGRYGGDLFVKTFYDHVDNKNIISNSSDLTHFTWHYLANESWGEPWWSENFRESHLDLRLSLQKDLIEDLMPRKMGQYSLKANTTLNDINWIMGICAGFDAGIDFYVSPDFLKQNKVGESILAAINKWEKVRNQKSLTSIQKEKLRELYTIYDLDLSENKPKIIFVESWKTDS